MANFRKATKATPGAFPILTSKSAEAQKFIRGRPDGYLVSIAKPKKDAKLTSFDTPLEPTKPKALEHAAHLLVTAGQRSDSARLTAVACETRYLGSGGWLPVPDFSFQDAMSLAVFLNSTAGRIQLMRQAGKTLSFPTFNPGAWVPIRGPDLTDVRQRTILSACWERTAHMEVPQFRDGDCTVRRLWDVAVADVMGWDAEWLAGLRHLLHAEPHVRGLGCGEFGEELEPDV
ncbi:MAG: hypothetical protein OXE85_14745 [Roseovarius sp.]|nr:hypothetical protein [Roseovarius sp.]